MSFESGSISLRIFYVPRPLPDEYLGRFSRNAAPPIETLGADALSGWVSGRHLLDRVITEDNAFVAGYLRLTLMKAERKIPEALLRAECMMEELAEMQAQGVDRLRRQARAEIRKSVTERLLPTMPPSLTGIPVVYDERSRLLYAGATTEKQTDALTLAFRQTTGIDLIPMAPATAAMERKRFNVRDMDPTSFSPECEDLLASDSLGQDFLTWLWFFSEACGGTLTVERVGTFGVMIEGPLTFVREADGAHVTVLRKGSPEISAEAKTALLGGKKLSSARVTMAQDDASWTATLDAEEFIFRGLKIPKGDPLDPVSRFQERMFSLATFRDAFLAFFDCFIEERADRNRWADTRNLIHEWVSTRKTKQ